MIPVALYARYSSDLQDPCSIEQQLHECRRTAERLGCVVVDVHTDHAVSGTHTARAGLQAMLARAESKARPYRAVIVHDLSRLSRDIGDTWDIVYRKLGARGIKVMDTMGLDSESESGELMVAMQAIIHRGFIRSISKNTHRGMSSRAGEGFAIGGLKYGYKAVREANPANPDKPRKLWTIYEPEAAIVRRIFQMRIDGTGFRFIAATLNAERAPAPRGNAAWNHTAVRNILRRPIYTGQLTWNTQKYVRTTHGTHRALPRPESEHVVREVPELAIVDRDTWDRVQRLIERRARGARKGQTIYLLSGLLRCGACGAPMTLRSATYTATARHIRFGCSARATKGPTVCANGSTLSEQRASAAMVEALRGMLADKAARDAFARGFARRAAERAAERVDTSGLETELAAARKRVQNATRLLVDDPDDLDLRRQRETDKATVRRLESELAERASTAEPARRPPDPKAIRAAIDALIKQLLESPERGRAALMRCVGPMVAKPLPGACRANQRTVRPRYEIEASLDVGGLMQRTERSGW